MKQKTLLLLLFLLIMTLTGLTGYLFQQRDQQLQQIAQNQQVNQKQLADLNDRLVAVARQQGNMATPESSSHAALFLPQDQRWQLQLNRQRSELRQLQRQWALTALHLSQDYLKQANYQQAQQLLLELQQNIIESQQTIADPFNHTLLQTIKIDQLNISQEASRQQQRRDSLGQVLAQLQQQLNLMAVQPPSSLLSQSASADHRILSRDWFKHLFLLEPAQPQVSQHMLDRSFICKQASINIAMARQAVNQNHQINFNSNINEALGQLNLLTDPAARHLVQHLNKLKNQTLAPAVELTSLTLLSGQKGGS
ncbi:hypothetical protein ACF3NA_00705 [Alkanindiges sp. WGS2144]|uniref:hypothetical protein n=1 Tax=Alkanindiges sp. WGS2144 TaxID=3366808 RepID=UPI0037504154